MQALEQVGRPGHQDKLMDHRGKLDTPVRPRVTSDLLLRRIHGVLIARVRGSDGHLRFEDQGPYLRDLSGGHQLFQGLFEADRVKRDLGPNVGGNL
ncbi:hypothetical protein ACWGJX_43935 [Streptomyces sp. NPDC054775]